MTVVSVYCMVQALILTFRRPCKWPVDAWRSAERRWRECASEHLQDRFPCNPSTSGRDHGLASAPDINNTSSNVEPSVLLHYELRPAVFSPSLSLSFLLICLLSFLSRLFVFYPPICEDETSSYRLEMFWRTFSRAAWSPWYWIRLTTFQWDSGLAVWVWNAAAFHIPSALWHACAWTHDTVSKKSSIASWFLIFLTPYTRYIRRLLLESMPKGQTVLSFHVFREQSISIPYQMADFGHVH